MEHKSRRARRRAAALRWCALPPGARVRTPLPRAAVTASQLWRPSSFEEEPGVHRPMGRTPFVVRSLAPSPSDVTARCARSRSGCSSSSPRAGRTWHRIARRPTGANEASAGDMAAALAAFVAADAERCGVAAANVRAGRPSGPRSHRRHRGVHRDRPRQRAHRRPNGKTRVFTRRAFGFHDACGACIWVRVMPDPSPNVSESQNGVAVVGDVLAGERPHFGRVRSAPGARVRASQPAVAVTAAEFWRPSAFEWRAPRPQADGSYAISGTVTRHHQAEPFGHSGAGSLALGLRFELVGCRESVTRDRAPRAPERASEQGFGHR